jgi:hypothetical protein
MSELNVSMSLTLADAASGPLRAFAEGLAQLKANATGVAANLEKIAAGITSIGKAAASASAVSSLTSSLDALAPAMARVRAEGAGTASALGNIGSRATAGVRGTYALEQAMAALSGTLSRSLETLTAMAAGLGAVGAEARAAGAGVAAGASAMGAGMAAANTQASTLMQTLKGVGMLYAALKIEQGLKASTNDAIEYQNTATRLRNMNVSPADQDALTAAAAATSKAVPQFSQNQTLEMGIDLRNATGSVEHALTMLTPFAVAAYNMKMATPAGQTFDDRDMLLIAKALEQRNATMDPVKMQAELDMMSKIYATTQGRVDAQQILGNLQYAKGGLGQTMDLSFMPIFAAMIEQIKSGGGNGGQIGTSLTSLQQSVLNGTGNGQAQKERALLGLIAPPVWNNQGNVDQQKSDLRMAGADQFQRNPYEWVQNILKPALVRAGIDLADDAAVNQTLNKLFPNRNAASIASMMINRGPLLEKDAANINQTADNAGQRANNIQTTRAQIDAMHAQFENLGIVLGKRLLPMLTALAQKTSEWVGSMADFFSEHPIVASFAAWGAAILAVTLAISGMVVVFGTAASLMGISVTASGALSLGLRGVAAAISFVGEASRLAMGTWGALAAALVGGFAFGTWLSNLEPGGKKISDWAADLAKTLVDTFSSAWRKISGMGPDKYDGGGFGSSVTEADGLNMKGGYVPGTVAGLGAKKQAEIKANAGRFNDFSFGTGRDDWNDKPKGSGLFDPSESPGKAGRYNEGADVAANQFKREEDDLRANLKAADDLYRLGLSSVEEYYGTKQAVLDVAIDAEIAALMKEKAAFDARGNKAGSNRAQTQIDAAQNRLQTGTADNEAAKARELLTLDQKLAEFRRAEFQSAGERHQAELLRIQQTLDAEGKVLIQNGLVTQSEIDAAKARATAASEYSFAQEKIGALQDAEKQKEEDIQAAVANGTITTTAGDDQIYALRQKLSAQLDDLLAQTKELADASGDPKLVRQNADQTAANNRMGTALPADAVTMNRAVQTSFENLFSNIIGGSMSATQAFRKFGSSIIETFQNLISKRLGDQLYASLFSSSAGGGGGGSLGDFFGSLFGGSSGSTSAGSAAVDNGSVNLFADAALTSFDVGTDYVPHDMIAMIHEGEKITPAAYNKPGKDGAGMTVHNHFTVTGPIDNRSQQQIAAAAGMGVSRAVARAR